MFFSSTLQAQSWNWAVNSNGYNYDNVQAMCVDNSGNTYIAGQFYYTVTFPAVSGSITLTSPDADLYVACFNTAGKCLWAKPIVLSVMGQEVRDLAINNTTGECFVTGWFFGTATVGTLPVLTSAGASDILVAKFNMANGNPIWAKRIGNANDNIGSKIATDAAGNSYITGDISSPVAGSITIAPLAAVNGSIFSVKLNAAGTAQWARGITTSATVADVRTDGTGNYIFGSLYSTLTTGALTLTPTSGSSAYLIKLNNSDGTVAWGTSTTGAASSGTAMDIDGTGKIIIGGTCGTTTQFSGSGVSYGTGLGPAYLAQYNTSGVLIRADQISATEVVDLDIDCTNNNVYISGGGVFVKKFTNPSFGFGLAWTLTGTTTSVSASDGGNVGVDQSGNVYVAGSFESTATFGSTTLTATSAGDAHEAYIAKITYSTVSPIIIGTLICTNSGSTTLTVTNPQSGLTYSWYTTPTGGSSVGTGVNYLTPTLTATTTYYLAVSNGSECPAVARIAVTVTVNNSCCPTFIVPTANNALICTNSGTAILTVTNQQSGYVYKWYTASTGGTLLTTGTSYTTGTLTSTTIYYVQAGNSTTCPASSRTPVTVTVNNSCCPTFIAPTVNTVQICTSGAAVFNVTNPQSSYIYKWYTTSTGGTPLTTGTSYTTPTLTTTTTYYVEAANSTTCPASSRTAATATINSGCCTIANVSISSTQQNPVMGTDVTYQIMITNSGPSALNITSVTSLSSTLSFNVTSINSNNPFVPFTVAASTTATINVLGTYASFSTGTTPFDKCFSVTISGCTFQVCQPTLVLDPLGVGDADFTINGNNVPVRTSQAVNFTGDNFSGGTNYWYVKPAGGSFTLLPGSGNTVSYAFPDLGNYYVQHNFGSYTLTKAVTVTGENRALAFSTAEVSAGTNTNYGIGNFTLEAYVKPTTLPTALNSKSCFFSNMYNTDGFEFGVNASGKLYLQINSSIYTNTAGTTLVNGTCYHVAVTRSTNTFTFYVNGTASGSTFTTSDIPSFNEATLFIGRSAYSDGYSAGQFIGLIEDARIWSIARTQSQISSNIYNTLVGNESGLLSYWPINEGSGTVINDIAGPYSGYVNSGSLSEQTWTTLSCSGAREGNEAENAVQYQTTENVNVYPVPFTTETHLTIYSSANEAASISITDIMGSTVYKADGLSSNTEYTIGKDLTSGIYTVIVHCGDKVEYKKIVKQ